jgi:hypothetical protein
MKQGIAVARCAVPERRGDEPAALDGPAAAGTTA